MNFLSRSVARALSSSLNHSRAAKLPTRKWVISRQITSGGESESPEKESAQVKETPEKELSNPASGGRTETPEKIEYGQELSNPVNAQTPNSVQDISPAAMTISPPPESIEWFNPEDLQETISTFFPELLKAKSENLKVRDGEISNSWKHLLENPKQWLDHRWNKANGLVKPRHPDFKRKGDGISLWLNKAPEWVLPNLEGLEFGVIVPTVKPRRQLNEQLWKDVAENPHNWSDNRLIKTNPRAPDFVHKETGEALWMPDSPMWVLSKLPPLRKKD